MKLLNLPCPALVRACVQMIGDVGFFYGDSVGDMAMAVGFSDNV